MILATVVSPSPQTNTATITDADQFDPVTANNTASVVETPQHADLVLTKTVNDPTPNVGDTITFTVTLDQHAARMTPRMSVVTDLLPAGLSFVSATPSQGTYDPRHRPLDRRDGQHGEPADTADPGDGSRSSVPGAVTDATPADASARHRSDQFDPNTGNNTATATETPQQADLGLSKTVDNPTPNVGDTITYTITLTNNGPDAATNVQVTDLLPARSRLPGRSREPGHL